MTAEVLSVRTEPTAEASLAAMRARSKFGIAIAAMIKIIATTISNSISEKPFCFLVTGYAFARYDNRYKILISYEILHEPGHMLVPGVYSHDTNW